MRTAVVVWFVLCVISVIARFYYLIDGKYPRHRAPMALGEDLVGAIVGVVLCLTLAYLLWGG